MSLLHLIDAYVHFEYNFKECSDFITKIKIWPDKRCLLGYVNIELVISGTVVLEFVVYFVIAEPCQ